MSLLQAHVIQHLAFEDLGSIDDVLRERGVEPEIIEATQSDFDSARDSDLVIVLGGPISANDSKRFPFLAAERALIEHRLKRALPTLGICLGAQLMAQVLGAKVYPMTRKEIGFSALRLTEAGKAHALGAVTTPVLHWHGEMFELPAGTLRLASTELCIEQAFSFEAHSLALQFHLEVRARELERWLVGHIVELEAAGVDLQALRAQAKQWGDALEKESHRVFDAWLDGLGCAALPRDQ
ncbi:MAG: glutamine amidotransferase [Gammaproteobacteria bacterium]|nr:glutamine amidotransferase [Gammaproteobacteria bacterium]